MLQHVDDQLAKLSVEVRDQLVSNGKIESRLRRLETLDLSEASTLAGQYRLDWLRSLVVQDRNERREIRRLERHINELLDEHGTTLRDESGIGPIATATLLCAVGDPNRFARESKFARWCGTGAVALSSGEGSGQPVRHRLDLGGNRKINSVLYVASITQQRRNPQAIEYLDRKTSEGDAGLVDRPSRPRRCPNRTSKTVEKRICRLCESTKWGSLVIGLHIGVAASTVHRVLVRHGVNRLKWLDRPTGKPIRRYEREHPGELVHLDIKKVGGIPSGGGWKVNGRAGSKRTKVGYTYLHCAVDDHSRVAYVEAHDDESGEKLLGFWKRARRWFHSKGMIIDEVMSDNGGNFRYGKFGDELQRTGTKHIRIKPYRPQTNGKVERFNRTLADEFLYARIFRSETERRRRLTRWVHIYNLHRNHTAIGGPPASRVNNVCGHYT